MNFSWGRFVTGPSLMADYKPAPRKEIAAMIGKQSVNPRAFEKLFPQAIV